MSDTLAETRKKLRDGLLIDVMLKDDKTVLFEASFDGYGDSGDVHAHTGNVEVDRFLEQMVYAHTNFDWYNSEGGGGDITWDVVKDVVTINGYQNVVQQETAMDGVKF